MDRIYLDHAATTPMLPEVAAAMEPWLRNGFGNPSSLHAEGRHAKSAIDESREALSVALGCLFADVIFTSSGTEAANLAIIGAALANEDRGRNRILLGSAEHHCVLHTAPTLQRLGYTVEMIPVDETATIKLGQLNEVMGDDVLLVSVMHANNELGTIQPVHAVAELAHRHGAHYHCDAVQTFLNPLCETVGEGGSPKRELVDRTGADLITVSAHKVHGPKGVGALYVRAGTKIKPLIAGGGQERELRGGTENVAGIVGFGEAVRQLPNLGDNRKQARDNFLKSLHSDRIKLTAPNLDNVLPGHAHLRVPGVSAETMLILLDRMGISPSSGAACSSGSIEPSHVLMACGYSESECKEGLRFTFGRETTVEEAKEAAKRFNEAVERLSGSGKLSP